jgi:transcriptional regulator GlxA family with amidase domain
LSPVTMWLDHDVRYYSAMHFVGVLALHGVIPFDLAIPCEAFGSVPVPGVAEPYLVRVCGESREVKAGAYDLRVTWDLQQLERADTIVVPGIRQPTMPIGDEIVETLRAAARRGARIASICTGAFVLAAAGLLDGKRATTHWRAARELAELYPKVIVDPNVLFVDAGQILTSAGAAAGIDLCLHMIRRDYGAAAAAAAARLAVVPLERDGGQAQYIAHQPAATNTTLEPVLQWMDTHLQRALTLSEIAAQARTSTRTLSRRFKQQLGTTPLSWVLGTRVRRAQALLESSDHTIEEIAAQVGFESAATLRLHFRRIVGVSPTRYRRALGTLPNREHVGGTQRVRMH